MQDLTIFPCLLAILRKVMSISENNCQEKRGCKEVGWSFSQYLLYLQFFTCAEEIDSGRMLLQILAYIGLVGCLGKAKLPQITTKIKH